MAAEILFEGALNYDSLSDFAAHCAAKLTLRQQISLGARPQHLRSGGVVDLSHVSTILSRASACKAARRVRMCRCRAQQTFA